MTLHGMAFVVQAARGKMSRFPTEECATPAATPRRNAALVNHIGKYTRIKVLLITLVFHYRLSYSCSLCIVSLRYHRKISLSYIL